MGQLGALFSRAKGNVFRDPRRDHDPEAEFDLQKEGKPRTIWITDGLVAAIEERIGFRDPEHGGVLLASGNLFHTFVDDEHGRYSDSHWDVSDEVVELCVKLQKRSFGVYGGQVHSHPAGVPDPSTADRELMKDALSRNPGREFLLLPVVTVGTPRPGDVAIGLTHRMSIHIAERTGAGATVVKADAVVVPWSRVLSKVGIVAASFTSTAFESHLGLPRSIVLNGKPYLSFTAPDGEEGYWLLDCGSPFEPMLHLAPNQSGSPEFTPFPLQGSDATSESLGVQIDQTCDTPGLTSEGQFDRVASIVGDLSNHTVLVAGLGSVGTRICEDLVRSGVGRVVLIDPDEVAAPNVARSSYLVRDVGKPKVEVFAKHLTKINPSVRSSIFRQGLGEVQDLSGLVRQADLVIGATDDMHEQSLLSHVAYTLDCPMVACALYRKAAAGEVVFSLPMLGTPCIVCATTDLSVEVRPEKDYGSGGRLVAENALGPSINLVSSFASILALTILTGPDSESASGVLKLVSTGRTYGKISSVGDWDFFPRVFEGMSHQYAPQSVWIKTMKSNSCGSCGESKDPVVSRDDGILLREYLENPDSHFDG